MEIGKPLVNRGMRWHIRCCAGTDSNEAHAVAIATNVTHGERDGCASHGFVAVAGSCGDAT